MSSGTARLWLRPGLVGLHVFAVVAVAFCVFMGLWQLGVYDSRQEHERADEQHVPPSRWPACGARTSRSRAGSTTGR